MSNLAAVQNSRSQKSDFEICSPFFSELKNDPSCKIVWKSRGDFAGPTTSSMPKIPVHQATPPAGDPFDIDSPSAASMQKPVPMDSPSSGDSTRTSSIVTTEVKIEDGSPVSSQWVLNRPTSNTSWREFRSRSFSLKTAELNLTFIQLQCTRVCCRSLSDPPPPV